MNVKRNFFSFLSFSKAQASLEYLATYGWAFMGILITLGALAYFGVFDTSFLLSPECTFVPGASCHDFIIGDDHTLGGGPAITVDLRNSFGTVLEIVDVNAEIDGIIDVQSCVEGEDPTGPSTYPRNWNTEEIVTFSCTIPTANYVDGRYYRGTLWFTIRQAGYTYEHNISGTIGDQSQ